MRIRKQLWPFISSDEVSEAWEGRRLKNPDQVDDQNARGSSRGELPFGVHQEGHGRCSGGTEGWNELTCQSLKWDISSEDRREGELTLLGNTWRNIRFSGSTESECQLRRYNVGRPAHSIPLALEGACDTMINVLYACHSVKTKSIRWGSELKQAELLNFPTGALIT